MISPVNNSNVSFKSAQWFTDALTYVSRPDAFGTIAALEATVDTGRAVQAKKRGGKNEMRERMIEDITSGLVWLFGVKSLNYIGDKILKKLYGGTFDVGTDNVLRTPFDNFMKDNAGRTFAKNPKAVALVKGAKVLTSVILADAFIGLILPKINQKLTRFLIAKDKEKKQTEQNEAAENKQIETSNKQNENINFKGGGIAALNVFTNAIENTNIGKLLSTDAGLTSGRIYSARNNDERREIAIRDLGSIYFYMFAANHIGKLLNLAELGHASRLNPDSTNILTKYLIDAVNEQGGEMTSDEFRKLVLGDGSLAELPEGIKFEEGKLSWFTKLFNKNKEPLKVAKVSDLEGKFEPEVMEKIRQMSELQPLRQGEAVVTKQQIIDAMNPSKINDTNLLKNVFSQYTGGLGKEIGKNSKGKPIRSTIEFEGGAYADKYKYVSNDKLYKLKAEMETYVNELCQKAKDGKITENVIKKAKDKNLVMSGINFAAGFGVAALFLSTLIPKFQYWVTKKRTGRDAFPGTYGLEDNNPPKDNVQKAS